MPQLQNAFDATQFDPTQSSGGLPIGRHKVVIETSEIKPTQANDGGYLQLNLNVIEGPQAGSKGAYRLNLYNSSQQAVEIANRQLSALCHVTGVFVVNESEALHNIPFIVDVQPQKGNPEYTEVKKVFDINGNEPGKQGQAAPAQQPAAQPAPAETTASTGWGNPTEAAQPAQNAQPPQPAQAPPAEQPAQPAWGAPSASAPQPAAQAPAQPAAQPPAQQPAGNWQQNAAGAGNMPWTNPQG